MSKIHTYIQKFKKIQQTTKLLFKLWVLSLQQEKYLLGLKITNRFDENFPYKTDQEINDVENKLDEAVYFSSMVHISF